MKLWMYIFVELYICVRCEVVTLCTYVFLDVWNCVFAVLYICGVVDVWSCEVVTL